MEYVVGLTLSERMAESITEVDQGTEDVITDPARDIG